MIELTLGEISAITGGQLSVPDSGVLMVRDVVSDSRYAKPGSLFVALKGTNVDGHEYAPSAFSAGATAAISTRPAAGPTIVVGDVLHALGQIARHHLDALPGVTVIAITGSVGKTTTKDLVAQLLESTAPTVAPPGSFNNELGLPMTVLSADANTQYLVLELGARKEGHVAYLCKVAPPDIGVELAVGTAHLGEFGSVESIARAKAELVRALGGGGTAVLNADDARVMAMAEVTEANVMTFGLTETANVRALEVTTDTLDRPHFTLVTPDGSAQVHMQLSGSHLVPNALAAASVATVVGMDPPTIAQRLSGATPRSQWRMDVNERADGVIIINDSYNASPESMRAALRSLKQIGIGRRTWAVLGEMRELGDQALVEHDAIGRLAVRLDVHKLVAVGSGARPIHLAAHLEGSWGDESRYVETVEEAVDLVTQEVEPGDVVLVKASRAAGLEAVAAALADVSTDNPSDRPTNDTRGE